MASNSGNTKKAADSDSQSSSKANKYNLPEITKARRDRDRRASPGSSTPHRSLRAPTGTKVTLRSRLLDRIEELKIEIKEIEHRITKRHRELERWKHMSGETSRRRLIFVQQLDEENAVLEQKLQQYDGQVVNVAFFLARAEEQHKRAQARLAEVKRIQRALESRDKKAAHTIEVVHRFMPTSEELELREVNETVYTCASLEKNVAKVRNELKRAQESLELMNGQCAHLQREVERRNLSSISRKTYEIMRDEDEVQKEQIIRLKGSVSVYINALESERTRMASMCMQASRAGETTDQDEVRQLSEKRKALQDETKRLEALVVKRIKKINKKKMWIDKMRRAAAEEDIRALASETAKKNDYVKEASLLGKLAARDSQHSASPGGSRPSESPADSEGSQGAEKDHEDDKDDEDEEEDDGDDNHENDG